MGISGDSRRRGYGRRRAICRGVGGGGLGTREIFSAGEDAAEADACVVAVETCWWRRAQERAEDELGRGAGGGGAAPQTGDDGAREAVSLPRLAAAAKRTNRSPQHFRRWEPTHTPTD